MATTYDIAKILGVHQSTVSRVLSNSNQKSRISRQTREKILKVAAEHNYYPNFAARSLATSSVRTVGVCVFPQETIGPNLLGDYYLPHLIDGIQKYLYSLEFDLLIVAANRSSNDLEHLKKLIYQNRVEGLILLSVLEEAKGLDELVSTRCPIVLVNSPVSLKGVSSIKIHNRQAAMMAVEHLIALGHSRIGFLGYMKQKETFYETERREGYEAALVKHGISARAEWISSSRYSTQKIECVGDWAYQVGYLGMSTLIERDPSLTSVFCISDLVAAGALAALADHHISVPEQFSVVGFDNSVAPLLHPQLTTINHEFERMGSLAAQKIIETLGMSNTDPVNQDICLSLSLIKRKSTGPCKQ